MVRNRIAESLKPAFRNIDTLRIEYGAKQPAIEARLEEFRRTGRGEDLAILDRHILRNLIRHGVLRRLPRTLTPRRYLDIETRIERFSKEIGIPMAALDLIFWSRETGEIFK